MKWISLILAQLGRNPKRSILTFIAILLALFMYTTLQSVLDSLRLKPSSMEAGLRMAVIEETGGPRTELPVRYEEMIRRIPHIEAVSPLKFTITSPGYSSTGPYYVTFGVDPFEYGKIYPQLFESVDADEIVCMETHQNGALIGSEILEIQDWVIGQEIELFSLLHEIPLLLHICGDIRDERSLFPGSETQLIMQAKTYGELSRNPDRVNMYWIRIDDPNHTKQVEEKLKETFQWEVMQVTLQSEGAMMSQISEFTATIQQMIQIISIAVLITILIVSANTIAISTRERYKEIALLKVLGFQKYQILLLVLSESILLSLLGGMAGTGFAWLMFKPDPVRELLGMTYAYSLPDAIYYKNLILSTLLGGLSGWIPALRATNVHPATLLQS